MASNLRKNASLVWVVVIAVALGCAMLAGCGSSASNSSSASDSSKATQAAQSSSSAESSSSAQEESSSSAAPAAPVDPDANLVEQPLPENGAILDGVSDGYAGVGINASPEENVYVKIKDPSGYTVVGFFVTAGSSAEVYVPEGTYSAQFASGTTWYGPNDCFGSKTSYGQDDNLVLGYGEMVTYTLELSPSGNFSLGQLNGAEF